MPAVAFSRHKSPALRLEAAKSNGALTVFLGMAPGVGKTFAMLQAARRERDQGVAVLICALRKHGRKETEALLTGLPMAPLAQLEYRGTTSPEMDLAAVLRMRPELAIVDELAHINVPGSVNPLRCEDVIEFLKAGIDVFTTLNISNIESLGRKVEMFTGTRELRLVPDALLACASRVELIDLTPRQLRRRVHAGKVQFGSGRGTLDAPLFREDSLHGLRELSLNFLSEFSRLRQVEEIPSDIDDYMRRYEERRRPRPEFPRLSTARLSFDSAEAAPFLWYGWSHPEGGFRWSDGHEAGITFRSFHSGDLNLALEMAPYLGGGKMEQAVLVRLNGEMLTGLRLSTSQGVSCSILLPASRLRENNTLVFQTPNAAAPSTLGLSRDTRRLAIKVRSLQFVAASKEADARPGCPTRW